MRSTIRHIGLRQYRMVIIMLSCACCFSMTASGQETHPEEAEDLMMQINDIGLFDDECLEPLLELKLHAVNEHLTVYEIEANYLLGKYHLIRLNSEKAKHHFRRAAFLAQLANEYEKEGFALDRLGISYIRLEKPDSALLCFQQSSDIYRKHGLEYRLWNAFQGMSMVYQFKGDYERAKSFGEQGLASIESFDESIARTILLNHLMSLASEFNVLEDYSKYLDEYLKVLSPSQLERGDMHLAAFFATDANPADRIIKIQKAIDVLSKRNPTLSLLSGYYRLGQAYDEMGNIREAIDTWETGLKTESAVSGSGYGLIFTRSLSEAYAQSGQFEKAYNYHLRYQTMADSLANLENTRQIDELQVKYETAQKENLIQSQKNALDQNRNQRLFLILISILIAALAAVTIFALRSRLKLQRSMNEKQKQIHEMQIRQLQQKSKLDAMNAMLSGQEEERKRIAYDLHDGLGGLLTSVKLSFQSSIENQSEHQNGKTGKAIQLINEAYGEVRRIAHNMMPHALVRMGLDDALMDLATSINLNSKIEVIYQNLTGIKRFDKSAELNIYRIVQELVTNAQKHAEPGSIIIQLSRHNGTLLLVVEDDGNGMSTSTRQNEGLGLSSIHSRVRYLNGKIDIQSNVGSGTTVTIELPLHELGMPQVSNINRLPS